MSGRRILPLGATVARRWLSTAAIPASRGSNYSRRRWLSLPAAPAGGNPGVMRAVVQNNAQLDANSLRLADDQPVPTPDPHEVPPR